MNLSPSAARVIAPPGLTSLVGVSTAPRKKGVYAWWFDPGALEVPDAAYATVEGRQLFYVGIAPRKPSPAGKESSSRLRNRLTTHTKKDASRSTLRLSLGALLADELNLSLRLRDGRVNWGPEGEITLSQWMTQHARVSWVVNDQPWVLEDELIGEVPLALNVNGRDDPFAKHLSQLRRELRHTARQLG
jgi:hypothetical protein